MKITGVTVYEYDASWVHGAYGMSHGRLGGSHCSLVVRVGTDEGVDGWARNVPEWAYLSAVVRRG